MNHAHDVITRTRAANALLERDLRVAATEIDRLRREIASQARRAINLRARTLAAEGELRRVRQAHSDNNPQQIRDARKRLAV